MSGIPPGTDVSGAMPKWFVPAVVILGAVAVWYFMRKPAASAPAAPTGTVV